VLWRELEDRYGEYFEGGMAEPQALIDRLDFDEEESAPAAIDPQEGQRPCRHQRKQKAIKRMKIVASFNRPRRYGRG
jgi:DNA-directed RNA polymerase subunit beta'